MSPLEILKKKFGFPAFRLNQEAIINNVLQKRDTFALMPTGGGKSLCYQIPALMFDGLTVVISPLIALMKDQVDALRVNGIEAAYLNSTQSHSEHERITNKIQSGELKILYLAPESNFFKNISSYPVSLLAIDEAHCISHWGHDFRPEYLTLSQLKRAMPGVPVIALTATADSLTRKDILEKLELNNPSVFVSSFNRANIRYTVKPKQNSFDRLLSFLENRKEDSGIIYCLSRASTESLAQDLKDHGFSALAYHAGLDQSTRTKHQDLFSRDEIKIIVATIAFGMGIDKSNVRFVVHTDLPKNVESYYQETGRAGRDGLDSEALLFYSYGDVMKMKRFVEIDDNPEQTRIYQKKLEQMGRFGQLTTCRRKYLLNYFDEQAPEFCGNCDVCLTSYDRIDGTVEAQKVLSAVTRLEGRYGAGYVIDFLRGSNSAKIQEHHKELKTYGVGANVSKEEWGNIIRQLTDQNYLTKAEGQYPTLMRTEKSDAVLKGMEKVMLVKTKERVEKRLIVKTDQPMEYEAALFHQVKELRRQIASEENVPAFVVLSDASLLELATYLPFNKEDFTKISGFGEVKIEKYGKKFWEVVAAYCRDHNLKSRIHLKAAKRQRSPASEKDSDTKRKSFELFEQGHSTQQIAEMRGLSPITIDGHLAFFVGEGKIPVGKLMNEQKIKAIQLEIDRLGSQMLSPIKEALGDEFSFGEIRLTIAHMNFIEKGGN